MYSVIGLLYIGELILVILSEKKNIYPYKVNTLRDNRIEMRPSFVNWTKSVVFEVIQNKGHYVKNDSVLTGCMIELVNEGWLLWI